MIRARALEAVWGLCCEFWVGVGKLTVGHEEASFGAEELPHDSQATANEWDAQLRDITSFNVVLQKCLHWVRAHSTWTWNFFLTVFLKFQNNNKPEKRYRLVTFLWHSYDISTMTLVWQNHDIAGRITRDNFIKNLLLYISIDKI